MNKNVLRFCSLIGTFGLFSQVISFLHFTPHKYLIDITSWVLAFNTNIFFSTLTISRDVTSEFYVYSNSVSGMSTNFISLTYYVLTLLSALLYWKSDGKEIRLVRFVVLVLFLGLFTQIVHDSFFCFFNRNRIDFGANQLLFLRPVFSLIWLYPCYRTLKYFHKRSDIHLTLSENTNDSSPNDQPFNYQRILIRVVDLALSIMQSFWLYSNVFRGQLEFLESVISGRILLYVFIGVLYFMYTFVAKALFNLTPGGALVGYSWSIINAHDDKSFKSTLLRVYNLKLFKDKNRGAPATKYYKLILFFLVMALLSALLKAYFEKRDLGIYLKKSNIEKREKVLNELNNLSTESYILISEYLNGGLKNILKIEEIYTDSVVVSHIQTRGPEYKIRFVDVVKLYEQNKLNLSKFSVSMADLRRSIYVTTSYKDRNGERLEEAKNLVLQSNRDTNETISYYLNRIYEVGVPNVDIRVWNRAGELNIHIDHDGPKTIVESFWEGDILIEVNSSTEYWEQRTLTKSGYEKGKEYEFTLDLLTESGKVVRYQIKGINQLSTVSRIY